MKKHSTISGGDNPDHSWTLFLDRDGVINQRIEHGYVLCWKDFRFQTGVLEALALLSSLFGRIIVVTNQQGVGKGYMTTEALEDIHSRMRENIDAAGGRMDAVFTCTELATAPGNCRKPAVTMGLMAAEKFPDILFGKSIMVGDSMCDMEFAENLGMWKVFIGEQPPTNTKITCNRVYPSLAAFALDCCNPGNDRTSLTMDDVMGKPGPVRTMDDYICTFPGDIQIILQKIREVIREVAPGAMEVLSYGMPAFCLNGKRMVYFAAHTNHIGFYALPTANEAFKKEIAPYKHGKGSIQFPLNEPIPYQLVRMIAEFRKWELEGRPEY